MGHYYGKDGTPEHFRGPNGSATTLREARKLGLLPSCTEVLNVLAKPGLERWKIQQAVLSALTLPKVAGEASDSLLRRIDTDASKQAQEAAAEGTAIHAAIEASFAGKAVEPRFRPHVSAVHSTLRDNFGNVPDWTIEKTFGSPLGFGGCVDISSRSLRVIGDHKGVAVAPDEQKQLAYTQHYQLGGYAEGLDMPDDCRGFNLFISRTHPGHVRFFEWPAHKMQEGREVFRAALKLWQAMRGMKP